MGRSSKSGTIAAVMAAFFIALTGAAKAAQVNIEKIPYFNQPNCYKITNGTVDVIVTSDIGPRVIAYRLTGGSNVLAEIGKESVMKTEFGEWHPWGGHRLWHAPESIPRTYVPDNSPLKADVLKSGVRLTAETEKQTGIQKELLVELSANGSEVTLTHKLTNNGVWPVELAVWGLTIVKGGGEEIIPNEPFISHDDKLLPARAMTLWNYTDLSDSRFTFGKGFTRLKTDLAKKWPNKIGLENTLGWTGYFVDGNLFVKRFAHVPGSTYPDKGCNYETYTDGDFMEMESLGPVTRLEPGQAATHIERWYLFEGVKSARDDEALQKTLAPLLKQTKGF